jgi:signal transduction histidine kinase
MGLGLYIAHAIVVEHGGNIRYDYESPYVTFTVELPLRSPSSLGDIKTESARVH